MAWHRRAKKMLVTLVVDNYAPQITQLTFPLLKHFAKKHGYEFHVLTERHHPEWPPVMEKFQCYELFQKRQCDYMLFIDADALVHPDMFDPWAHIPADHCFHNGHDMCNLRWDISGDRFFQRDGRMFAGGNWLTGGSWLTYDIWAPHDDLTVEEAITRIYPLVQERQTVIEPSHLIDDYLTSRNISKYGLKFAEVGEVAKALGVNNYFWHLYTIGIEEKVQKMKQVLVHEWKIAKAEEVGL